MAKKTQSSPLDRAIAAKERAIKRIGDLQRRAKQSAENECQRLEKVAAKHRIILAALKAGNLKP